MQLSPGLVTKDTGGCRGKGHWSRGVAQSALLRRGSLVINGRVAGSIDVSFILILTFIFQAL